MSQNWNPENWLNIPDELTAKAQWMVCGDDKVPRAVSTGYPADNTNPYYWSTFNDAYNYASANGMWIGFCFSAGSGLTCIDIDNKVDPQADPAKHAENQQRMQAMYRYYDTYIEQSKSANGLHIVVKGEIGPGRRRDNVEVYSQERFIIMTGDIQKARPLLDAQPLLDSLIGQMTINDRRFADLEEVPPVESDADVAKRILHSRSGQKFEDLIASDWYARVNPNSGAPYGEDPSRADLSFATLVGFFTKSNGQIWSMFKQTALGQRLKDGKERHPIYDRFLVHTIKEARGWLASDAGKQEASDWRDAALGMLEQFKAQEAANEAAQRAKTEDPTQSAALNWKPESDHEIVNKHQFVFKKPYEITFEPPLEWALENVFQKQSVNAIYGWSGVGKSFIALDLMMAVSEGRDWFGHETEQMHVSYLALEGGEGMRNRLEAYRIGRGIEYQLPHNVDIYRGHFDICNPEHVSAMIYQRQRDGMIGGMFVIDTFAKAIIGADENSAREMGPAVQQAKLISEQLKACVVLVHHSTKPDKETGLAGMMRGSGSIQAGIEGVMQVARRPIKNEESGEVVGFERIIVMDKIKEGADLDCHPFELNVVKIGERVRKSGEIVDITSCNVKDVAHQVNSPVAPVAANGGSGGSTWSKADRNHPASKVPSGGARSGRQADSARQESDRVSNQQLIINAVHDEAEASRNFGKYGAPENCPVAPADEVIKRAVIAANKPDPAQHKRDLKKAVTRMREAGNLGGKLDELGKEWLWVGYKLKES